MALAKYAEDNLEMYYERMAMTGHTVIQASKSSYLVETTGQVKIRQKEGTKNG